MLGDPDDVRAQAGVPDHILARYVVRCLHALGEVGRRAREFYGPTGSDSTS